MNHWLKSLNPEQQEAAAHNEGPLLILAGAGSGKTTVLVSRTGRLIDEGRAPAGRICVLTFTNKAAQELKHRVAGRLGEAASGITAGTFHGWGLQFLKEHWREAGLPQRFGIIDAGDSEAVLKDLLKEHNAYEKARLNLSVLAGKISHIRQFGKDSPLDQTIESAAAAVLAPKYMLRLRALGVVDFEELLLRPLHMMRDQPALGDKIKKRYDFVMVDEFQDTNHTQMRLIEEMCGAHRNIAVVGDDDQSIYGWRGAEIQNILGFPKRYRDCKVIRLERNYRSTGKILDLANAIIAGNKTRHQKVLKASGPEGGEKPELFVFPNEDTEIDQVVRELSEFQKKGFRWKDMAILYRSNSQGGLMEGGLRRSRIPYKLSGGTALFDRKEAKDVLAFVRCSVHPSEIAFRRIINLPARGIGDKTIEAIEAMPAGDFLRKARDWARVNVQEKSAQNLQALLAFLENLKNRVVAGPQSAEEIFNAEFRVLGYREYVNQSYQDAAAADSRWLCVTILGRILDGMFERHGRTVETLESFIDCMELRDAPDDAADKDQVNMMTLHACKGLEFPLVVMLGLEEEMLPHARLGQNVDEERRLFYVGVTRAKKHLILSRVEERRRYGQMQPIAPSRFLLELPAGLITEMRGGRPLAAGAREAMLASLHEKLAKQRAEREKQA